MSEKHLSNRYKSLDGIPVGVLYRIKYLEKCLKVIGKAKSDDQQNSAFVFKKI